MPKPHELKNSIIVQSRRLQLSSHPPRPKSSKTCPVACVHMSTILFYANGAQHEPKGNACIVLSLQCRGIFSRARRNATRARTSEADGDSCECEYAAVHACRKRELRVSILRCDVISRFRHEGNMLRKFSLSLPVCIYRRV
jgi:hypothetical protein